jgi:hypothetical protein
MEAINLKSNYFKKNEYFYLLTVSFLVITPISIYMKINLYLIYHNLRI